MDLLDSFINIPFLYTNATLLFVCIFVVYLLFNVNERYALMPSNYFIYIIGIIVIWWIASRPVTFDNYGDRATYARHLISATSRPFPSFLIKGDYIFQVYVWICGHIMGYQGWFWLTGALYVINYARACVRMVGENASVMFLLLLVSFGFTAYATNTIRAGLAASFCILGLTYYQEKIKAVILLVIAFGIHFSMIIPITAAISSFYYDKTKLYLFIWVAFVGVSYSMGHFFETFFSSFDAAERAAGYLNATSTVYKTGFRWDFLTFGAFPIVVGIFYKYYWKYESRFYNLLLNTYILANAIWLLVIRVPFTDRFAYLSWFMMPFVLMYPLLKQRITKRLVNQVWMIVLILAGIKTLSYFI